MRENRSLINAMTNSQPIYGMTKPIQPEEFIPRMGPSGVQLSKLVKQIAKDATDDPKHYLRDTLVPEGGE